MSLYEGRISRVVIEWLEREEWQERPTFSEDGKTSSTEFNLDMGARAGGFRCFFEADEDHEWLILYAYAPVTVSSEFRSSAMLYLHGADFGAPLGSFKFNPNTGSLRFVIGIDVEGGSLSVDQISTLVGITMARVEDVYPGILSIIYGGATAEELLKKLDVEHAKDIAD